VNRLFVDFKEDCNGCLVGRISFPKDSVFTFEALAEVIEQFSQVCGVPPREILDDVKAHIGSSSHA